MAEVRDAPLNQIEIQGTKYDWYDPDALDDIDRVDLLVIGGPRRAPSPFARHPGRYPALSVLKPRLAAGATIVAADVSGDDDRETVRHWLHDDAAFTVEPVLLGQHAVLTHAG